MACSRPGSDRKPKWRAQSVERIHCGNRDREVNQILWREVGRDRGIRLIGGVRFAHAGHLFGPRECGTLLVGEQMLGLAPYRHQRDLVDRHRGSEITTVLVDAVCAAVDLRHAQEHEVNQFFGKIRFARDVVVDTEKCLCAFRCKFLPIQASHHSPFCVGEDA